MGTDKAMLRYGGATLLERSVAKMQAFLPEILIVGCPSGKHGISGVRTIPDIHAGCGPLGGIHAALESASHDLIFVTACDMPFWGTALARFLIDSSADYDGAVPAHNGYFEPLLAVYGKSCLPAIEACLSRSQFKVSGFFSSCRINLVDRTLLEPICNPEIDLYNVNTIEDLQRAPILPDGF